MVGSVNVLVGRHDVVQIQVCTDLFRQGGEILEMGTVITNPGRLEQDDIISRCALRKLHHLLGVRIDRAAVSKYKFNAKIIQERLITVVGDHLAVAGCDCFNRDGNLFAICCRSGCV